MAKTTGKPKILIVDDNKGIAFLIHVVLGKDSCVVHSVSNGQEALDYLDSAPGVDLIILDLRMPKVSGVKFLEQRRNTKAISEVPVILLSGDLSLEDVAKEFGVTHFIEKGRNPSDLAKLVCDILPGYTPPESVLKKS